MYAVRDKYGLDWSTAYAAIKKLVVYHPYGSIGDLQWQTVRQPTPFGIELEHPDTLLNMADRIRTFTEKVSDAARIAELRNVVADARNVVFLGFAYHPQNLELLKAQAVMTPKRIYGTVKGVSGPDQSVIDEALRRMVGAPTVNLVQEMNLHNGTCSTLFDTYSRSLTQA